MEQKKCGTALLMTSWTNVDTGGEVTFLRQEADGKPSVWPTPIVSNQEFSWKKWWEQ